MGGSRTQQAAQNVSDSVCSGTSSGGGGGTQQIQLWQFLLELLTDPKVSLFIKISFVFVWCSATIHFNLFIVTQ